MVKTTILQDKKPRLEHIVLSVLQKFVFTMVPKFLLLFEDVTNEGRAASLSDILPCGSH